MASSALVLARARTNRLSEILMATAERTYRYSDHRTAFGTGSTAVMVHSSRCSSVLAAIVLHPRRSDTKAEFDTPLAHQIGKGGVSLCCPHRNGRQMVYRSR